MNNINFGYRGIVRLNLKIGDKIISVITKNNGTDYLKKAFCKFLSGNYGGSADIPQMLDLRKLDENNNIWRSCLNQEIILTGKTYLKTTDAELGVNDNWVARFSAAIPYAALISPIEASDSGSYRLYLYGTFDSTDVNERYHDIAYIDIDALSLSRISPGTQALVEWSMQLLNVNEIGE